MSELDNAMLACIKKIVLSEHRPFSYQDLLCFRSNGKEYRMKHGTIRNKLSKMRNEDLIEICYNSGIAFYSLKGVAFGRRPIRNPMRVSHHSLYDHIVDLPLERRAIHDIRLQFKIPNVWGVLSRHSNSINSFSKDIALPTWELDGAVVKVRVHRTDTVTVIVACSSTPILLDYDGVLRLSNCLTRAEERIQMHILELCGSAKGPSNSLVLVPLHTGWIVTMWHFGADALTEYTGQTFCMTWKAAERVIIRAYSKEIGGKTRIRLERQEYPRKSLFEAIQEKLE